ncbi:MAG TPA: PVC-type heme-binding CxxCH protein [Verrucomicrobiae bacterium]|nr:PVC-type heme-binding CxxCH protein [Verrucomicrobiae bacterium]
MNPVPTTLFRRADCHQSADRARIGIILRGRLVLGVLLVAWAGCAAFEAGAAPAVSPLSPAEALRSFELEPGLQVELVAAEPLTVAPCAVAWDGQGRLFVAENRGYPTGGPEGAPVGRIALLTDSDHDGILDRRTEFATGLTFPNGLMPWRGGLIVTCAPDVFYFKDTDGDGRADEKEVLLTGFATNASTQLRVNRPLLGPDGWVYLASGLSGGRITAPKRPGAPALELRGDLRFKPDTGEYEALDGKSQFGQSFDDFGRRFGVFNRVQVQHFVLPSHYVERNPHLTSPGVLQNCPELIENPLMRGGGAAARIYPISANLTTADSHAGTFSAACAIHVYRGGALGEAFVGNAFTCDPTGNLVHRDQLIPVGATFAARRSAGTAEVLRSRDDWFRPVFLETGPDGALYVCDMYRKTIEHPEYLPAEIRKRTDFDAGKDRGRIWRITAKKSDATPVQADTGQADATGDLTAFSSQRLLAELNATNLWRRETAFRLFVERNDPSLTEPLHAPQRNTPFPPGIALRLHLLAFLGALSEFDVRVALASSSPGVREVGLKLAEPLLAQAPSLQEAVLRSGRDANARVRFQSALALGVVVSSGRDQMPTEALPTLAWVGTSEGADKWTRAAVLSSVNGREQEFLRTLLQVGSSDGPRRERSGRSSADNGRRQNSDEALALMFELGRVLAAAVPAAEQPALVRELLAAQEAATNRARAALTGLSETRLEVVRDVLASEATAAGTLREWFGVARRELADGSRQVVLRQRAGQLLAVEGEAANATLLSCLHPGEAGELVASVARVLSQPANRAGVRELLSSSRWSAYTPSMRGAVLAAVLSRPEHYGALLDAIEGGQLPASALAAGQRDQLKRAKDEAVKQRAQNLLTLPGSGDRRKAFEAAKGCLELKPVPSNGRRIFGNLCAPCHRLDQGGVAVGPDLFDIRNQPKETILLHIIIPEQEIAPNFANYICETKDGRVITGLISSETAGAVSLRQAQGVEETVLRTNMLSLKASPLSLMPQELEKGLTLQELADLLAYVKGE